MSGLSPEDEAHIDDFMETAHLSKLTVRAHACDTMTLPAPHFHRRPAATARFECCHGETEL